MGPSLSARSQGLSLPLPLGGTLQRNTTLSLSLVSVDPVGLLLGPTEGGRRKEEKSCSEISSPQPASPRITPAAFPLDTTGGPSHPPRTENRVQVERGGGSPVRAGLALRHVTCVDRGINSVLIGRERRSLGPRPPHPSPRHGAALTAGAKEKACNNK